MSASQGGLEMDTEKQSREKRVEEPVAVSRSSPQAESPDKERSRWEGLVDDRMNELHRTQTYLAERAQKYATYSALVKASVIILGALVATKETISVVIGTSNTISI